MGDERVLRLWPMPSDRSAWALCNGLILVALLLAACPAKAQGDGAMMPFGPATAAPAAQAAPPPPPPKPAPPAAAAKQAAPSPGQPPIRSAPRASVEARPIEDKMPPEFQPLAPPPLATDGKRPALLSLLAAAEKGGGEEDAARWVEAGKCWVWYGAKREAPWTRYRFSYDGTCLNGRAEGTGNLDIKVNVNGNGASAKSFEPRPGLSALWRNGVPLADKPGAKTELAAGLSDRTVLAWAGSTINDEAEIFAISKADDQGQISACQTQAALAVVAQPVTAPAQLKLLARRGASVLGAFCPEKAAALWTMTLVPTQGLSFYGRQGGATVQPVLARAEIREGLFYELRTEITEALPLLPTAQPVQGAQPLTWTETKADDRLMALALPAGALLIALSLGATFFNMLKASRNLRPRPAPASAKPNPGLQKKPRL
jgi:hypothetical protein